MAWYKKAHLFLLVKGRYVTKKWRKSIKGWKDSLQGRDKKHNSSKLQKKTNFTTTRSKHSTYLSKEPQKKIPTRHSYTWINFSNCIKLQAGIIQYHWGVYNILHKKKKKNWNLFVTENLSSRTEKNLFVVERGRVQVANWE